MTTESASADTANRIQPEPLTAQSMGVSLTVKDLRRSMDWYRDVVGFTVDREYEREGKLRAVALKSGAIALLINQDDGGKGFDRVKGEGFSIQFTTGQTVDAIANRIKSNGGTLESEPADMPWGARVFRLVDPDGFKLVISSPR
jgi:lactoylglutathione lyase